MYKFSSVLGYTLGWHIDIQNDHKEMVSLHEAKGIGDGNECLFVYVWVLLP